MLDGEIIETLWSTLNYTASSARSMSWFHRQEYLDTHMGDSNWKKLINMSERSLLHSILPLTPPLVRSSNVTAEMACMRGPGGR